MGRSCSRSAHAQSYTFTLHFQGQPTHICVRVAATAASGQNHMQSQPMHMHTLVADIAASAKTSCAKSATHMRTLVAVSCIAASGQHHMQPMHMRHPCCWHWCAKSAMHMHTLVAVIAGPGYIICSGQPAHMHTPVADTGVHRTVRGSCLCWPVCVVGGWLACLRGLCWSVCVGWPGLCICTLELAPPRKQILLTIIRACPRHVWSAGNFISLRAH